MPPDIVTHADAVRLLTTALRKERIEALLRSWLARVDDLEAEAQDLGAKLFDIDALEGAPLRVVARLVGAPQVADDEEQRLLIRTRLLVVRSSGTGDDLLGILAAFVLAAELELVEYQPAAVVVGRPHDFASEAVAIAFLQEARAAGVKLQLVYSPAPEAETFRHSVAPDPALADNLAAFETTSGLTASLLWSQDLVDLVAGEPVAAVGDGAVEPEDAEFPTIGWGADVFRSSAGINGFLATSTTAGNISAGQSALVAVAYRLPDYAPDMVRTIAGKRDAGGSLPGWEIVLTSTGQVQGRLDAGVPPVVSATLPVGEGTVPGWHVAVLIYDDTAGQLRVAVESATSVLAFVGDPTSTEPLAWGTLRGVPGPDLEIKYLAVCYGAQVEAVVAQDLALALRDALAGAVTTGSARGYGDAPDAVASYEAVTGLTAAYLWSERLFDSVAGEAVAAVGDGAIAVETLATVASWGELVYASSEGPNGFAAESALAADPGAASYLVAVAYHLPAYVVGAQRTIAGKRETLAPFQGWEIYLTAAGLLEAELDDGAGLTVNVTLTGAGAAPGWHVVVLRHDATLGQATLAIESESAAAAFAASLTSDDPIGWGTYRGVDGPDIEIKLVVVSAGAQVEAADPEALALALRDSLLTESFPLTDGGAYAGAVE